MKLTKQKKTRDSSDINGFTLIEILLVLVLAGGVFLALYSIFGKTISNDNESKNEVIASSLAQEGVEIIRNIRDENELNSGATSMADGLNVSPCHPSADFSSADFSCNTRRDSVEKDGITGLYQNCPPLGCTAGNETGFSRICYIDDASVGGDSTEAFAVSCEVMWTSLSGIERKARAMNILTNWQEN